MSEMALTQVQSTMMFHSAEVSRMSAGSKLEVALVANAIKLSQNAASSLPATWNLVQVEFAATNFSRLSAASAPSIHKFLHHPVSLVVSNNDQAAQSGRDKSYSARKGPSSGDFARPSEQHCSAATASDVATEREAATAASKLQCARTGADCLTETMPLVDVDIDQQRQMLRDIEVRQALSRQPTSNQSGAKRMHTGQGSKQLGKQSKLVHDTGQQTIMSLFTKR